MNSLVRFFRHFKFWTLFNDVDKTLPPYHDLYNPQNTLTKVTQMQKNKMCRFLHMLLLP